MHARPEYMKRKSLYITGCLLFLVTSFVSFSQTVMVKAAIDRNKILIGEPITLKLEANVPNGTEASWCGDELRGGSQQLRGATGCGPEVELRPGFGRPDLSSWLPPRLPCEGVVSMNFRETVPPLSSE